MKINRIQISNFRNIQNAELDFHPNVNWIVGDNGSGKTSILEAVYCLGSARSFRTSNYRQLINFEANALNIFAEISDGRNVVNNIGVQVSESRKRIRINSEDVKTASSLAELLAVQVMTPDQSKLIEEAPRFRRKFIDWGMFHVEHRFKSDWRRLTQSLKQRNAQLKISQKYQEVEHWDRDFLDVSEKITHARERYVQGLMPYIEDYILNLENFLPLSVELYHGWPKTKSLSECIRDHYQIDRKKGLTQHGPQKADLRIKTDQNLFKDIASRGQIKLLATVLKLSQLRHLRDHKKNNAVLLIDDLASEFDLDNQQRIFDWSKTIGAQLFVTCTDKSTQKIVDPHKEGKMFHVEHGSIVEIFS